LAIQLLAIPAGRVRADQLDVARVTPLGHPTINLDGRYRTTSRPPTTGLRPLRTDLLTILYRSSSQVVSRATSSARANSLMHFSKDPLTDDDVRPIWPRVNELAALPASEVPVPKTSVSNSLPCPLVRKNEQIR